jgi:hypothetical protein
LIEIETKYQIKNSRYSGNPVLFFIFFFENQHFWFTTKRRNSKGRTLIRPKKLARSCFGPPARFGHFVFIESQMVEEI